MFYPQVSDPLAALERPSAPKDSQRTPADPAPDRMPEVEGEHEPTVRLPSAQGPNPE